MSTGAEEIQKKLLSADIIVDQKDLLLNQSSILQQYKLYVGSAESISSRRQTANSFFLTVNSALLATSVHLKLPESNNFWLISIAGIAMCLMWNRLIRSYRDLNTAKFIVIHEIEKFLPIRPYDAEWEAVERGKNKELYLPFSNIEVLIPYLIMALYIVTFFQSLL